MPTVAELGRTTALLEAIAADPLLLAKFPDEVRIALFSAAGRVSRPSRDQARLTFRRMGHAGAIDRLPAELFDCFAAGESMPGYARAYSSLLNGALRLRGARPAVRLDEEELRKVRQPVLLINGDRDPFGKPDDGPLPTSSFTSTARTRLAGKWLSSHLVSPVDHPTRDPPWHQTLKDVS